MTCHICSTCGHQFPESERPPDACAICTDDRQYVGWEGQQWTTLPDLQRGHELRFEVDVDLLGIDVDPSFAIPQRALVLATDAGTILWECVSLVTDAGVERLRASGGIDLIVISHPHFYSSMIEWSDALGGVPILLHGNDREWASRTSPSVVWWSGDRHELSPTVTLLRCPGHFPGSTVLHWTAAPGGRAVLLSGDALHVTQDRRHVAFPYSVPNHMPARPADVAVTRRQLAGLAIDDCYGYSRGRVIVGGARQAIDASFDRYFAAVSTLTG